MPSRNIKDDYIKTITLKIDFAKYSDGLVPVIVQDFTTSKVLMLGFMNDEAVKKTEEIGKVTFF